MVSFLNRFPKQPPVPPRLGATLGAAILAGLNLAFQQEIWPNTPHAELLWAGLLWLAAALLLPQVLVFGWQWLRSCQGPAVLRLGLAVLYLASSSLLLLVWALLVLSGPILLWSDLPPQD